MKKIGIISELNMKNVNYGNRLQAFALNYYLNKYYNEYKTESLVFKMYDKKKITKNFFIEYVKSCLKFVLKKMPKFKKRECNKYDFSKRVQNCNLFTNNNIRLSQEVFNWKRLKKTDYDICITGSDVVWAQRHNAVNRIRFLDFKNKKNFKKIAYAASFGNDYIPNENIDTIRKYLLSFSNISVRENSSVKMLKEKCQIDAKHTCDPTLLLTKEEWKNVEIPVKNIGENYVFVYLLGKNKEHRQSIKEFAKKNNLKVINVPHANGVYDDVDNSFGDYTIDNCSPENWIWLIHNAEYVITDSFHGVVFSTIFEKRFFVLKREYQTNINNRMLDYLKTINEIDKFVDNLKVEVEYSWDYDTVNKKLTDLKIYSKDYIKGVLKEDNE